MKRLVLLLLAGCASPAAPATPQPPALRSPAATTGEGGKPSAVRHLVDELRSDDIEARERAEVDLVALGEAAEAELRDAMKTDTAEVRARIESVLEKIEIRPTLPTEGRLGEVAISHMHAFAWQNAPRGETIYVSTVWSLRNRGSTEASVRIARARVVHKGRGSTVRITGTKGDEEPDPVYVLGAGNVKKPALKMPECPAAAAGEEVYAVLDFADGAGRILRLRSDDAGFEKTQ